MFVKIIVISLLFVLVQHLARLVYLMGYHKPIFNHVPGNCQLVPGIDYGSEDIYVLSNGLALISSGYSDDIASLAKTQYSDRKGRIFLFDFLDKNIAVHELRITGDFDRENFGPHGIGVWEDPKSGEVTLFVVNHHPKGDRVEVFDYIRNKQELAYRQSVEHKLFINLNDVLATGPNSFYATNMGSYSTHILRVLEGYLMLSAGTVVHFDGKDAKVAASGFWLTNGIEMSLDKKHVYVSSLGEMRILKIQRDATLSPTKAIPLYGSVDNISVDRKTGDIYVGLQPKIGDILEHIKDNSHLCPSQVLRIQVKDGTPSDITELFSDDGKKLSASTVAVHYNKQLLIGTVYQKLMHCQVKVP